ncbi:MAG: type II secretion system GspH family protein [Betaproteobacteria bacterium]|nr:type II secretion system GspH family protein [Betaproteobacteria bacterium]
MFILNRTSSRGFTLVELIVSITVIAAGVAGILLTLNIAVRESADPLIQKQALAIAESLLEEIQLMPFTYCDPDDAQAETATSATVGVNGCAITVEAIGPEASEARNPTGPQTPFDNVNDYHGFSMTGIVDITGAAIAGLGAYAANVTVVQQALSGPPNVPAAESLLITVSVTGPGSTSVQLSGYRTRFAPNLLP